jgi:hypothetical protein
MADRNPSITLSLDEGAGEKHADFMSERVSHLVSPKWRDIIETHRLLRSQLIQTVH